eukprot:TRINITY_DN2359_c0_g1_i3.p2 TRINITY_DN2359_c0_g1~~TRINITY_DN2359_c0_g1_i3.p2  ORF type:complete len:150 (+),score=35.95 TRINITY_DN2359_c0_g1_i3:89-538(+)
MIRRPPRSTLSSSSAASDVYKRQALFFTLCFTLKHKLRQQETPEASSFTDQDECKIQRCINSKMATNWEILYGEDEGKRRQIECFKICHLEVCKKRVPAGQEFTCNNDESGKPYPEDYNYFPTSQGLKDHLETRVEAPVETFYNEMMGN